MKNSKIITTLALCFTLLTSNATNLSSDLNSIEVITSSFKASSFCVAIVKGDLETVKKLVQYGEDVNQVSNGMTPLMYAAKYNRAAIVEFLISKGAKTNVRSDKGMTAMKYAEATNATDVIKVLENKA